jgi:hypothetical protein
MADATLTTGLAERLEKAIARVEQIVHLDTMAPAGEPSTKLADLVEDHEPELSELLGWEIPDDYPIGPWLDEELGIWLAQNPGVWLVQVETPQKHRNESGVMYSWGISFSKWFRAQSFEDAVAEGISWAESDATFGLSEEDYLDASTKGAQGA